MAFVEARDVVALGREAAEEAHTALRNLEASGLLKGSPDMARVSEPVVDS